MSFIAEGMPLKMALAADDVVTLKKLVSRTNFSSEEVVAQVAACFDYEATYSGTHLVLLHKRYTDAKDIPFVTYEEGTRDLRQLYNKLDTLLPGSDTYFFIRFNDLARSLSTSQLETISRSIPISQLSKEQQDIVLHFTVQSFLKDTTVKVHNILKHLEICQDEHAAFQWFPLVDTDVRVFGYEGPFGKPGKYLWKEVGLSHGLHPQLPEAVSVASVPNRKISIPFGSLTHIPANKTDAVRLHSEIEEMKVDGKIPDPNAPTPEDYMPLSPPPSCTKTLQETVNQISKNNPSVTISVDPALAAKPISLVGAKGVAARPLLQGLCDVYGLALVHPRENVYIIGLPSYSGTTRLQDAPAIIRGCLPLPWQHALIGLLPKGGDLAATNWKMMLKLDKKASLPKVLEGSLRQGTEAESGAQGLWFTSAEHRLRVLVEPQVEASPDKRLPMRNLGAEERRLFLFMVAVGSLGSFRDVEQSKSIPPYLENLDQCFLAGHYSPENNQVYMSICTKDASGKLIPYAGGGTGLPPASQTPASQ